MAICCSGVCYVSLLNPFFLPTRSHPMKETEQSMLNELQYYFVVEQPAPGGSIQLSLSSYAPFRDDRTTIPFDSEIDAALYFLEKFRNGAIVSSNDVETAKAIIRGDQPMFLYEEKQSDGT